MYPNPTIKSGKPNRFDNAILNEYGPLEIEWKQAWDERVDHSFNERKSNVGSTNSSEHKRWDWMETGMKWETEVTERKNKI